MAMKHDPSVANDPMDFYHRTRRNLDWRYSDRQIGQALRDLLAQVVELLEEHGEVRYCNIEVSVHKGVATLYGAVESLKVSRLAEDIANSIEGVNKVSNLLKIVKCGEYLTPDRPGGQDRSEFAVREEQRKISHRKK